MTPARPRVALVAYLLLAMHATPAVGVAASWAVPGRVGSVSAASDDPDCCSRLHPGRACPMPHHRAGAVGSPASRICRLTCARQDGALAGLLLPLAMAPESLSLPLERLVQPRVSAPDSPVTDLLTPPDSPPPRT